MISPLSLALLVDDRIGTESEKREMRKWKMRNGKRGNGKWEIETMTDSSLLGNIFSIHRNCTEVLEIKCNYLGN